MYMCMVAANDKYHGSCNEAPEKTERRWPYEPSVDEGSCPGVHSPGFLLTVCEMRQSLSVASMQYPDTQL